ncbi:thermophilic serine proteinase precursor [bacterium BMS3Bbin03]|nr:thermophilic serine proteinase precursor [bacterium BMS3Bbin03]
MRRTIYFLLVMGIVFSSAILKAERPVKSQKYLFDGRGYVQPHKVLLKVKTFASLRMKGITFYKPASITGLASVDRVLEKFEVKSVKKYLQHKPIPAGIPDDIDRIYEARYASDAPPWEVAKELAKDPNLAYAEPVPVFFLEDTPNDPMYSQQAHLPQIHAPEAWGVQKGDSSVVIAIVDCGVDYKHEDLAANSWINEKEKNGLPGVDDDGNGYVDDIYGWDFGENDPNPINPPPDPLGYYAHGTHVAGLAAAVTNNGVGVSGSSWNCRYMAVKAAKDDDPRSITNGYQGITYAADNGADVINLSWGGGGYYQAGQDVVEYAYNKGSLVVASAGNDPNDKVHYPSGYRYALSVGVVDSHDRKPAWGTWGLSVDVMAPGVQDLSTLPGNKYGRMSGSSMSAPVAAGVVALVKARHPTWSVQRIMKQVAFTADNIDAENPGVEGLLGGGRIDAYRAVTETNPTPSPPKIKLISTKISDSDYGNGNGVFEQGETITIEPKFHNYSMGTGTNVQFSLNTGDDSSIVLIAKSSTVSFVDEESVFGLPEKFSFLIKQNAQSHMTRFFIGYTTSEGFTRADSFDVLIGKTPVLIVDDDDGQNNVQGFYISSLKTLGVNYGIWTHVTMGTPSSSYLSSFPIVIWSCEWAFPSLDSSDRAVLQKYLDGGGNLFISGQDIGWDLVDPTSDDHNASSEQFFKDYLHAEYDADNANDKRVRGVFGDPIGNGLNFEINQPGRDITNQYPDVLSPLPGAFPVWQYEINGGYGGVRFAGDYRVVYFGFGFEAIDAPTAITQAGEYSKNRVTVMRRVLDYLNPIQMTPLKDSENMEITFPVNAILKGDTVDLKGMVLYWKFKDDSVFRAVPMSRQDRLFKATIPAAHRTTHIDYYLEVENQYYKWSAPPGAPRNYYQFFVGPDTIPPVIVHENLPDMFNGEKPYSVHVKVTDNISLDMNSVFVHYKVRSVEDSLQLSPGAETGLFKGSIPPVAAYGDTLVYWFTAKDRSLLKNRAVSQKYRFLVGLDNFERGLSGWVVNPPGWGLDNTNAHSGEFSINDSPGKNYGLNEVTIIQTDFGFDFSRAKKAMLSLWTKYYLEFGHDFGYIEVSPDGGSTWKQLGEKIGGVSTRWKEITRSLTPYTGAGFDQVKLRFRMVSDNHQGPPFMGWYIDDVQVIEGKDLTSVASNSNENTIPKSWEVSQNYPNPFNPETRISIRVPGKQLVRIDVYNSIGQHVITLVKKVLPAGNYQFNWKGVNPKGEEMPSGLYFLRVRGKKFTKIQKMVLMR